MEMRQLGRTGLKVSAIGLGTMTWGEQNSEDEAHEQMDYALAAGVNLFDTAEMYPVPPKAETQGRTEQYIGSWLAKTGARHQIVLATKVTGPGAFDYLRGGSRLDRASVIAACEASLKRLQTDFIDLYQIHWPQRPTNFFGQLSYTAKDEQGPAIEETLRALESLVQSGKVRHVGVSNETPWGVAEYLRLSGQCSLPRIASIQNPYSLLNRSFEVGLAEFAHREQVGLLAYSPLAFGKLSGKYADGLKPPTARLTLFARFQRYNNPQADAATAAYVQLARAHELDPAQMALAWVTSRPFVTSNLVGATAMPQLKSNIASAAITLSADVLAGLEALHRIHTIPAP
jgi:aryl-alcohol dehydrogenase-like predicted oxidoreductase